MVKETTARIKVNNKHFEISVDLDYAMKLRKGEKVNIQDVLLVNQIFSNMQSGDKPSNADLTAAFQTTDVLAIADRIVKKGEIVLPKEYRDEMQDNRKKKVTDFLIRNAVDARNGRPFTPQAIESAMSQAGVNITNAPIEQQILTVTEALKTILPIKIETKKLSITIPVIYTGKVYGVLNDYKEKEEWLPDGSLKVLINIPVGLQMDFFDKLNSITHGAAIVQEVKQAASEVKK